MSKKLITYLILPIAALLLIALLWFVGFCDVIPEVYLIQKNLAWIGLIVFCIALLSIIWIVISRKSNQLVWIVFFSSLIGILTMSYRLIMKQDRVPLSDYRILGKRTYNQTFTSTDKSIEFYYYTYSGLFGGYGSECLWIKDGNSIFRSPVFVKPEGHIYDIFELDSTILCYCHEYTNKTFMEVRIDKKSRQIDPLQIQEEQWNEKRYKLQENKNNVRVIYHNIFVR
jgi:hypothetical protein